MIKVEIDSVMVSLVSTDRLVLLKEERGLSLMFPIAPYEADALTFKLQQQVALRPLSFDLFFQILRETNLSVEYVLLYARERDGLVQAEVHGARRDSLSRKSLTVTCKLADGLLTALHFGVPLYVSFPLMQQFSGTLDELLGKNLSQEALKAFTKEADSAPSGEEKPA